MHCDKPPAADAKNGAIIGAGSALLDVLAPVPDEFLAGWSGRKGGMELIDGGEMARLCASLPGTPVRVPGGSAANTVIGCARLGLPGRLLAKVGRDTDGECYVDNARRAGVDGAAFKWSDAVQTGVCACLVTPDSERTLKTFLGASATLAPEEVVPADFSGMTHAHIEGYLLFNRDLMRQVLRRAREAGCTVSLDLASPEVVESAGDILPELLAEFVDMVFANEQEAAAFAGTGDPAEALAALGEPCRVAAVKLGAKGALVMADGEVTTVDAVRVRAVDTTGAGDLWASGFLYGLLTGMDVPGAGVLASAVAASVVARMGASIPESEWIRLRRLATAPGRQPDRATHTG